MKFSEYWNQVHQKRSDVMPICDDWLEDFEDVLASCKTKVLDLGCGTGNDTLFLTRNGFEVIACDYSQVALDNINKHFEGVETKLVDIAQVLPFEDNSFDLVIADLSLHYFDTETTKSVMREIKRILTPNGSLLARVNSTEDVNFGAGQGELIEENYYFVNGYNKRFFTLEDAKMFFSIIGEAQVQNGDMYRYGKPKQLIVIKATKKIKVLNV